MTHFCGSRSGASIIMQFALKDNLGVGCVRLGRVSTYADE